jgi:hypothetical protein
VSSSLSIDCGTGNEIARFHYWTPSSGLLLNHHGPAQASIGSKKRPDNRTA